MLTLLCNIRLLGLLVSCPKETWRTRGGNVAQSCLNLFSLKHCNTARILTLKLAPQFDS